MVFNPSYLPSFCLSNWGKYFKGGKKSLMGGKKKKKDSGKKKQVIPAKTFLSFTSRVTLIPV